MLHFHILGFLVVRSLSFSLSGPETAPSGEPVDFVWTREDGDPASFGVMQRNLANDAPILGVQAVTNTAEATTGIVSVVFDTAGQIILSGVDQLSYDPANPPAQLAPGKQLTVTGSTLNPISPPPAEANPTTSAIDTVASESTSTSTSSPDTAMNEPASTTTSVINMSSSNFLINSFSTGTTTFGAGIVNTITTEAKSTQTKIGILLSSTHASAATLFSPGVITVTSQITATHSLPISRIPHPSASPSNPSVQHATRSGPNKDVLIPVVVTVVLLILFGVLVIFLRRQRSSTSDRLHRFRLRLKRTSPAALEKMSHDLADGIFGPSADSEMARPSRSDVPAAQETFIDSLAADADNTFENTARVGTPLSPPPSYDGNHTGPA